MATPRADTLHRPIVRRRIAWAATLVCLAAACASPVATSPPSSPTAPPAPPAPGSTPQPDDATQAPSDSPTIETETTEFTTTSAAPSTIPEPPLSCVSGLTTREQAALLVWPAVYADAWPDAIATVSDNDIGGVLLMGQDGVDAATLTERLQQLEAASRHGLIVSTDEEGGDVQRLRDLQPLDSQRTVADRLSVGDAADRIAAHGALVREVGVDMVLGPVIDVEPNVGQVPLDPSRFFAGPPDTVTAYAAAYLDGWSRADLFATLKHFPGHGAASGDTHITAGVTPSLSDLESFDLKPYRDLVDTAVRSDAAVMIGHLTVPGLTDGVPATRSPAAIDYLRDELGYGDALLLTDALGMAAVGIAEPEASVLALQAGIDVVLFTLTSQTAEVINAIEAAVADGRLSADHVTAAAAKVMVMLGRDGHTCDSNQ